MCGYAFLLISTFLNDCALATSIITAPYFETVYCIVGCSANGLACQIAEAWVYNYIFLSIGLCNGYTNSGLRVVMFTANATANIFSITKRLNGLSTNDFSFCVSLQWRQSGLISGGVVDPGHFDFSRQISETFLIFPIDLFLVIYSKLFVYPDKIAIYS